MNSWILEMREYNYEILKYLKGKYNFVADQLSSPVRIVQRTPETTLLGFTCNEFKESQKEDLKWRELIEYLEGGSVPIKRYHRIILQQFVLIDEILYYAKETTDGSKHYTLVVPRNLKSEVLKHAHEVSGHLAQKKDY